MPAARLTVLYRGSGGYHTDQPVEGGSDVTDSVPTVDDVLDGTDLRGRIVLVTGGYGGVGRALSRGLRSAGARVVICGRDPSRAAAVTAALSAGGDGPPVAFRRIDLSDLEDVRREGPALAADLQAVDLVVANAGVMGVPHEVVNGVERHLRVNHLGHFALVSALRPVLTPIARVVVVTSEAAGLAAPDWSDLGFLKRPYDSVEAYGQSKAANLLFSVGLDRRLAPYGPRAVAASPGLTATDLGRSLTREDLRKLMRRLPRDRPAGLRPRSPDEGAATLAFAAITAEAVAGRHPSYCVNCSVHPFPDIVDLDDAERLWALSDALVQGRA